MADIAKRQTTTTPETDAIIRQSVEAEVSLLEHQLRKAARENRQLYLKMTRLKRKNNWMGWLFLILAVGFAATTAPLVYESMENVAIFAYIGAGAAFLAAWLSSDS